MGIFSKPQKQNELALVLDIGSSSVGGALFWMQSTGIPKIIFAMREPIPLEEEISIDKLITLTVKTLNVVVSKICMMGLGRPSRMYCVLSSPWYASQTRVLKLEKNTPFIFTEKLADSLIQKEIALFKEEYKEKDSHPDNQIRPIELKNMKTVLNGYDTLRPLNQKAKVLEMTIFASVSQEQILKKVEETIERHFHSREIRFSSFVMSSFTVARDMFVNQDNFLLINIGGEVTDISMIKKEIIQESVSYPAGRNFIIRNVAKGLGVSLVEAKSLISLYKDGHMADVTEKKAEEVISSIKTRWLKKFQESLSNLTNDISIPATIFITVDQDLAEFFSNIIKTEEFNQYTLTESKFRLIFLSTSALHGIATFEEDAIRDPFLIIESIYINRFLR
jgi:DNA-binding transcriptional MerR regulator